jgi:hypothetical protein
LVGISVFLLTFLTSLFISMHDFDFCFIVKDFGAKTDGISYTIDVVIVAIVSFLYSFD